MRTIALLGVLCACGTAMPVDRSQPDAASSEDAMAMPIPDAGSKMDAAPLIWNSDPACKDTPDSIYTTPAMLPQMRGAIVKCALGDKMEKADVQNELASNGAEGVVAQTGARVVKLAYRTVRSNGTLAVSTATVYLPLVPRALPAPIVLVGRPTAGIADTCAPSKKARPEPNLALPFAARGFITITPDFAGLGNEGTHAYLDNHEAANELFDGASAIRALVAAGDAELAVGYSQGGGVVLSVQALEQSILGKHALKGVAAIAPEWPITTKSFGYEDVMRNPNGLTGFAGLSPPVTTVLRHYGYFANRVGPQNAGDSFPPSDRTSITNSIEALCTIQLGGALNFAQTHLGDLVDDTFRKQVLACIDKTPGCTGEGAKFHQWMTSDFVTADAKGAKVLIVQGLLDQVMPAAGEAACDVVKLKAEGVDPSICTDTGATHDTILESKIEHVVDWLESVATKKTPPTCSTQTLPSCAR